MSKKIIIFLLLLTSFTVFFIIVSFQKKVKDEFIPDKTTSPKPTLTQPAQNLKKYTDEAGFSFSFPDTVEVTPLEAGSSYYSFLKVRAKVGEGEAKIEAVESSLKNIDDFFKGKTVATNIKKLKLADLEARQFTRAGEIITVALDQGVLFTITIEPKGNNDFWSKVNNQIIASFEFVAPESQEAASEVDDVVFEGEEIVE